MFSFGCQQGGLRQDETPDFISLLGGAAVACTGRRSDRMISRFIGESDE
jgi:hypothetical protein